jgi:hypothetical protein
MSATIPRQAVSSSNVASVGYDAATRTLAVEFSNGGVYEYDDVPADVADALMQSGSVGRAFHATIKSGGYSARKVA